MIHDKLDSDHTLIISEWEGIPGVSNIPTYRPRQFMCSDFNCLTLWHLRPDGKLEELSQLGVGLGNEHPPYKGSVLEDENNDDYVTLDDIPF